MTMKASQVKNLPKKMSPMKKTLLLIFPPELFAVVLCVMKDLKILNISNIIFEITKELHLKKKRLVNQIIRNHLVVVCVVTASIKVRILWTIGGDTLGRSLSSVIFVIKHLHSPVLYWLTKGNYLYKIILYKRPNQIGCNCKN